MGPGPYFPLLKNAFGKKPQKKRKKKGIRHVDIYAALSTECTVYAIQHRIRKLQEKANSGSPGGDSAPASPEKRKRGRPRKNAYEGAAGEETGSPKKVKQGPAKKAVENEGEHGVSGGSGIEDA